MKILSPTSGGIKGVGTEMQGIGPERRWSGHLKKVDRPRCMLPLE